MSYDEKKLISFKETIFKDIEKKAEILIEEALKNKKEYLKKFEERILVNEQKKLEEKTIELESKYKHEVTRKEFEAKREILTYRNKLIEDIIENCERNLTNFSKTLEYETYMLEKIKKTIDEEKREKIIIKIREKDLKLETQIKSLNERIEIKIEIDKKNILGGFKLMDIKNSIEIDETFKTALTTIMQDFYKTSKLNLKNF